MYFSRNKIRRCVAGPLLAMACAACAQTPASAPANDPPPPVAYASASEVNNILAQIKQTAQNIDADLGKARFEKWKADSGIKSDNLHYAESVRNNLQTALPDIITQLSNSPEDLAATFKLYRNLDALYDIFGQVAQAAGAFGSKDEAQSLSNDLSALQSARRTLGERMQNLATAKETELSRLRSQLKAAQAAVPPPPPKKTIVDDTEPPKKPVRKKAAKPATTPPPAASNPQPPPPTK